MTFWEVVCIFGCGGICGMAWLVFMLGILATFKSGKELDYLTRRALLKSIDVTNEFKELHGQNKR